MKIRLIALLLCLVMIFTGCKKKGNDSTTDITRQFHIIDMMLDLRVDDVVVMNILRGGEEMTVSITVTEDCLASY